MTSRDNSAPFGLLGWLNETRVVLPLRALDIQFEIAGQLADVTLAQVFENKMRESLDVTYTFPLPANAAVYRCEMIVDGRVVAAVVEEAAEARRQANEAKKAGHRVALVETVRDNLFQLELGNLAAGSVVILRLSYVQELDRFVQSQLLRIPTCPGVRYIPGEPLLRANRGDGTVDDTDQVPDASRLSPPRIDALHPDAAGVSLRGRVLAADVAENTLSSPSHPLLVRSGKEWHDVRFALGQELPDQDIVVKWTAAELAPDEILTITARHAGESAALSRLRGSERSDATSAPPREIWFLLDRSSSMSGRNWEQCQQALREMVNRLPDHDFVGLSVFNDDVQHLTGELWRVSSIRQKNQLAVLDSLPPAGGTEMLPALQSVSREWQRLTQRGAARHLVLLTDGQVGNEDAVLAWARKLPAGLKVHVFGMDAAVNDGLLRRLAADTGGRCVLVHPQDDYVEASLAIVNDFEPATVSGLAPGEGWTFVGTPLTDLSRLGERRALLRATREETHAPDWQGRVGGGAIWQRRLRAVNSATPAIVLLEVRERIRQLQAAGNTTEAIALAKRFNVLCPGTSFIAIDRTSRVPIATRELYQPAMAPDACYEMAAAPAPSGGAGIMRKRSARFGSSPAQAPRVSRAMAEARPLTFSAWLAERLASSPADAISDLLRVLERLAGQYPALKWSAVTDEPVKSIIDSIGALEGWKSLMLHIGLHRDRVVARLRESLGQLGVTDLTEVDAALARIHPATATKPV